MDRTRAALTVAAAALLLTGCGPQNGGTLTGYNTRDLSIRGDGPTGDGVDDIRLTIVRTASDGTTTTYTNESLAPARSESGGSAGTHIEVTVESLASDGWAECSITFGGQTVSDRAEGSYAVAECSATLDGPRRAWWLP
jgi:hypothetical protein